MAQLTKIDKNGSKHFEGMVPCDRCCGKGGSDAWIHTEWTCWKCGGSGKVFKKWIERTPEYQAKLDAKRQAKAAAHADEHAKQLQEYEAKVEAEEACIKAQKAISQYVGTVGEKITASATFDHTAWFDFTVGWMEKTMYIHTFKDPEGNKLIWKTSSNCGEWQEGDHVQITGIVKEHSEYNNEKQTILTRCKIIRKEEEK